MRHDPTPGGTQFKRVSWSTFFQSQRFLQKLRFFLPFALHQHWDPAAVVFSASSAQEPLTTGPVHKQTQPTITLQHFQIVAALSLSLSLSLSLFRRRGGNILTNSLVQKAAPAILVNSRFLLVQNSTSAYFSHTWYVHKCMHSNTKLVILVGTTGPFLLLHK